MIREPTAAAIQGAWLPDIGLQAPALRTTTPPRPSDTRRMLRPCGKGEEPGVRLVITAYVRRRKGELLDGQPSPDWEASSSFYDRCVSPGSPMCNVK